MPSIFSTRRSRKFAVLLCTNNAWEVASGMASVVEVNAQSMDEEPGRRSPGADPPDGGTEWSTR
jgi:hypothetical protein